MPMHDSTRDQILDQMSLEGWANESDGNVESPTGYFSRISNDVADIVSIIDAFGEFAFSIDENFDFSLLVGHFIIVTNSSGFLYVFEFGNEADTKREYDTLVSEYSTWLGDDD